ncbi:plasmid stabilization protein [Paraburkholderia fungorum]|jgi:hypothetical protein|uniref:plasmid stabilization protein n=1 Tax=Paraburkholderia fungorum TaxID=134537 RepID=UPI000DB46EBE|nr:plasmid stabilization protein [Paraburkholderia fungorum]PZR44929.1 MAG: plasmid stabilization protein [Paraburkholderia fungorum]
MRIRERLCVELGVPRPCWDAWCARRGVSAGEGVRQLIAAALDAEAGGPMDRLESGLARPVVGETRGRIEIRLTLAELEAIGLRAVAMGMSSNRWIVAGVRAQLMHEPQLGEYELRTLSASNQQLAVISRSLAQLVRGGVDGVGGDRSGPFSPGDMRDQIDVHLRTVAAVLRANLDRWSR